jgi:hypothetical protein
MSLTLDFNAFKKTPLLMHSGAQVLGSGGQAVVVDDGDTAVKLYTANPNGSNEVVNADSRSEYEVLKWLETHNDTGVKTPKPIDYIQFDTPVTSHLGREPVVFLAAVRMDKMPIVKPPFGPNWQPHEVEQAKRFYKNLGQTIAHFNNLAQRKGTPEGLVRSDHLPTTLQALAEKNQTSIISGDELHMLITEYAKLTAGQKQVSMAHGDMHQNNVSYDPHTQEINAVFDWGCAMRSYPGRDMFHVGGLGGTQTVQLRNDMVRQGFEEVANHKVDPALMMLYSLMHNARTIIFAERNNTLVLEDPNFRSHVVEPYKKTMSKYRELKPS